MNYSSVKRYYLALKFATQKLCHYLLSQPQSGHEVLSSEVLIISTRHNRTRRSWLLQLNEFDITVDTPRGLQSQSLSNLLTQFPLECASLCVRPTLWGNLSRWDWKMVPCLPRLVHLSRRWGRCCIICSWWRYLSIFQVWIPSNNKAKCDALIKGFISVVHMGICRPLGARRFQAHHYVCQWRSHAERNFSRFCRIVV